NGRSPEVSRPGLASSIVTGPPCLMILDDLLEHSAGGSGEPVSRPAPEVRQYVRLHAGRPEMDVRDVRRARFHEELDVFRSGPSLSGDDACCRAEPTDEHAFPYARSQQRRASCRGQDLIVVVGTLVDPSGGPAPRRDGNVSRFGSQWTAHPVTHRDVSR